MSASVLALTFSRLRRLLESRTFSFWVIGAWVALTLVWLVPFQLTGQSQQTVRAIAEDWLAFRVVYALVALATLMCSWTRISRDLRRLRTTTVPGGPSADAVRLVDSSLEDLARLLESRRYLVFTAERSLYAVKNRYSLIAGSVFHFGITLFGVALVCHMLTVESKTLRVTEGQEVGAAAEAAGMAVPAEVRYLRLDSIEPRYHEDVLLFTRLDARLSSADGDTHAVSLSKPYWLWPTLVMSVSDYGLAPHLSFTAPDGRSSEYVVAMNLSPPGTEDVAEIPDIPLQTAVQVYPDYGVVDGRDVSLSYNIADPAFLLSVSQPGQRGSLIARELLGIGEALVAEEYVIEVSGLSRYGTFRLTRAPALPFVALGLIVTTVGVAWRFLLRRSTVVAWQDAEGVLVDAWEDFSGRTAPRKELVARLQRER